MYKKTQDTQRVSNLVLYLCMPEVAALGPIIEPSPIKPVPVVPKPVNPPEIDQVQMVIDTLRKPEVRTPFSEVLLSNAQKYFGEVLNQENPPELIKKFNEQHGILLFSGSTLRGTARADTSDLDVIMLYDSQGQSPLEHAGEHLLDNIVNSPDYHPDKLSFSAWFAKRLQGDLKMRDCYESRRNTLIGKYKQSWKDDWKQTLRKKWERISKEEFSGKTDDEIVDHEIAQSFIFCEAEPVDIDKIGRATIKIGEIPADQFDIKDANKSIKDGNPDSYSLLDHFLYDAEISIPELLTTTYQFVATKDHGTLLHLQQRTVHALDQLRQANPQVFEQIYEQLGTSFRKRDVVYEGGSHGSGAGYYRELEKDYVVRSGRFSAESTDRASKLLRAMKGKLTFPSMDEMKKHYLYSEQKSVRHITIAENALEASQSRPDIQAIKEAQLFFRSLGLTTDKDGFVEAAPSDENIAKLQQWHESTTNDLGVIMPTEQDFYRKTLLATSLWHQQDGNKINYLLGKGTGVEVALRGNVVGRIKRPVGFSYRSHSDFELYAVNAEIGVDTVYPEPFKKVFGAQEYFPVTKTKGLKNIPSTLLHDTAELVDFGGMSVRIPQLELLFLDKYIARESTPRTEGFDAEVLAKQYVLDRQKVHQYLDQFVIQPEIEHIQTQTQGSYQNHIDGVKRNISATRLELEEEGTTNPTVQDLIARVNSKVQSMLDIQGVETRAVYSGIRLNLWETLKPNQIDKDGNIIDQDYLSRLNIRIKEIELTTIQNLNNKHQDLDRFFNSIDKSIENTEPAAPPHEPTPEMSIISSVKDTILDEQQFRDFRESNGFTDGFHGTWESQNTHTFLYVKPDYLLESEKQAQDALRVVRVLTEKGALYPSTEWGVFQTKDNQYQLFAITRRLEQWDPKLNGQGGRQVLKTNIGESNNYQGMFDEDSHILEWMKRVDPNYNPTSEIEIGLTPLLNIFEASHSDNWAWDENGKLYPIDIEVISVAKSYSQQAINKWIQDSPTE